MAEHAAEIDPLRSAPARLDPYRRAKELILQGLRWDLRREARIARRRLTRWRDAHAGERAVILCNGPSLNRVDFAALAASGVFCFGLNKINLLFERTEFRPSCVVAVNPYVIEQNAAFYNQTGLPLFLEAQIGRQQVRDGDNLHLLHAIDAVGFARDCSRSLWMGYTVTYVAMQLAFHMGFARVALVGCDHSFATKGPANRVVVSGATDESHFDPRYFSGGQRWQLPDLAGSEFAYCLARDTYAAFGREIVNCTAGGQLDLFHRQGLADFLA